MKMMEIHFLFLIAFVSLFGNSIAITMKQFEQSLDMMRSGCAPKFKLSTEVLDNLRSGVFPDDNKDLKCYTRCVAQMAGTLTKKGEINFQKVSAQIPIILPEELQEPAKKALVACADVQKSYSDSCDKVFYTTKCSYEFDPSNFAFP